MSASLATQHRRLVLLGLAWVGLTPMVLAPMPGAAQTPVDMEPGTWLEVPDTQMSAVAPSNGDFPGTWGNVGPRGVIGAWNSAAVDTLRGRLILHGGGHDDYYGNEIYAFDVGNLGWERLTDPTPNPRGGSDIYYDGTPQSRHTYDGLTYIEALDRFFVYGGAGSTIDGTFPTTQNVWTFDFEEEQWSYVATPYPGGAPGGEGSSAVYDPVNRRVWWGEGTNSNPDDRWGLWSYDVDGETWTQHNNDGVYTRMNGCFDSMRGRVMFIGEGSVRVIDVRADPPVVESWETTGANDVVDRSYLGLDYDPVADRVVAWRGGAVYLLNLETREWTVIDAPGAPEPASNGTLGRFSYMPSVNAFVSVNAMADNVFFFKNAPGLGAPLPEPPDAGGTDAGTTVDSGTPDAGVPIPEDSGMGDAATSSPPETMSGGCDCSSQAPTPETGLWLIVGLAWLARRRKAN